MRTSAERLREIQRHLGIAPDGVLGPQTLTALEQQLGIGVTAETVTSPAGLQVSMRGVTSIVRFEIGSDANYERELRQPYWPGGDSGVTIGIGYDLGYQHPARIRADWQEALGTEDLERLVTCCGVSGSHAQAAAAELADISVTLYQARKVFSRTVLPRYALATLTAFPGVSQLYPDAQTALVSLVFNRGGSLKGDHRREMREIRNHVAQADLDAIADSILAMKRLWEGRNLGGLLRRRDQEADLVRNARRDYSNELLLAV